ncbi:MAG: M48 family metalloprotease [Parvibaculum sp.]|nr:M48 family metalloprotease [Parvibaculum sp.]
MPKAFRKARHAGIVFLASLIAFAPITPAQARGISLIRDAETEKLLRDYSTPIWRAAGMNPNAVKLHLVNDPNINAFVAAGQRMFLNTGLILESEEPMVLIGVIAHETGHMAGGHLSRSSDIIEKATLAQYVALIAGVGAIAAGAGDAGMAMITGGSHLAQRSFLSYSRMEEGSADQAGAKYLKTAKQSGRGMLLLFEQFRDQEALSSASQDPFIRSHPISEERLAALEETVKASPYYDVPDTPESVHRFKMVQAKLHGYLDSTESTFRNYPLSDQSDYAHYARSVAYHKMGDHQKAHAEVDILIKKMPKNPYFWELKGQIDFESGNIAPSIPSYRQAHALDPSEPQFELALGQSLLATDKKEHAPEAMNLLKDVVERDPEMPFAYYQLSIAYGRLDQIGMAELSTAKYYETVGSRRDALGHALKAMSLLKEGSPEWLRAQDIAIANKAKRDQ